MISHSEIPIQVKHAKREHLKDAHTLANVAQRQRINYEGTHIALPWVPEGLQDVLNEVAFKVVHDDGD
jgi:hypothetical protein